MSADADQRHSMNQGESQGKARLGPGQGSGLRPSHNRLELAELCLYDGGGPEGGGLWQLGMHALVCGDDLAPQVT